MVFEPIEPSWAHCATSQQLLANSRRVDCRYWGLDEALTVSLGNPDLCINRNRNFFTLRDNRSKKHRNRQRKLRSTLDAAAQFATPSQVHHVECSDFLSTCLLLLDAVEMKIFSLLAADESYVIIAEDLGLSVGQVKSKIHRARRRLAQRFGKVLL
jgi:hypothetical protein